MPRSKDPLLRLLAKHHRLDEWERYTGPQGGEGWINTITGEKVYQEEKPGGDGSGEAESETYETAKSIIEEGAEAGVPAPYIYLSRDALNDALQTTNPEDVANALLDVVETHNKNEGVSDARDAAVKRVKEFVKVTAEEAYFNSKVEVSLFDDETVTFKGDSGKAADYDSRAGVVVGMLKKLDFTAKSANYYHRLIEKQNVGPAEGGSRKMESFNAVATEDIGASGHENTYTPTEEEVAVLRAVRGPMQLALRKMYGDTITLYRGESDFEAGGDYAESPEGEGYVNFDSHRPAESWSMRPLIAQNFGEFILKQEVPIERVILANVVGAGYDKEAEMLVAMDKEQPWEYGDSLFFHDDIEQDNEQLNDFDDNEVVTERELIAAELRAMKIQLSNNEQGLELAEWQRYEGPQGGKGWINTISGEKVYQEEKPGSGDGESAESQGYQKARDLIGETAVSSSYRVTFDKSATLAALAETTPEDTVKALYDIVAEKRGSKPTAEANRREAEIHHKNVRKHTNFLWNDVNDGVSVSVTLDTGDEVEFTPYGAVKDYEWRGGRGDAIKNISRAKGYEEHDIKRLYANIEAQQRSHSPGKQSLSVFNAVAREVGAEGQEPALDPPDETLLNMLRDLRKPMLKALRAMYGDTITLYRGEDERDFLVPRDTETVTDDAGNTYSEYEGHKPAESWSVRPQVAQSFGDIVLKREMPIEEVVLANFTGAGYDREMEMLCAMDHTETWEHGENMVQFNFEEPKFESSKLAPQLGPMEMHVAEYRALKKQLELSQSDIQLAQWVKYSGPRGGEGWQNVETGEVTYGEKPGDVDESQEQQTLPGAKIDTSERYTEGGVWNGGTSIVSIIQDVTGKTFGGLDEFYEWVEEDGTEADIREVHSRLATGPTPFDVTDDDVPDPKYNVNNYEEFGSLSQMLQGEMHGVSAENMFIAEDNRGNKLFITNLKEDINHKSRYERDGAYNAATASKLMRVMGEDTPHHHIVEGEYLAVEESHGVDLRTHLEIYHGGADDQRDTIESYASHIAANVLLGNGDAHQRNVFYKYGRYETIDMDMALSGRHPKNVMIMAARKFATHLYHLYGYDNTQGNQAEKAEAAYLLSEALEHRAGQMQAWLTEGEEVEGVSPDDLTDEQRETVESMIGYINIGEHWQFIRDQVV